MGLLGGIARTAVVAGTATAVSNRVSRRQYNRWSEQGTNPYVAAPVAVAPAPAPVQAPPAPAPSGAGRDRIAQLKDLASLKESGVLTDEEFAAEKAKILAS